MHSILSILLTVFVFGICMAMLPSMVRQDGEHNHNCSVYCPSQGDCFSCCVGDGWAGGLCNATNFCRCQ
ncbi:unnamed protein product, partial [Mesorhabditis belari]|uniref:Uncharacterized protein n=1 Tax=Mesorhabditis belari TaxID=2138241 RepID=A0AAF3J280_9BILA